MIKILLADDDAVERTALKEIIRSEFDAEIVEAPDGQVALDLLCDGLKPALCIVDLRMPKIDGIELLGRMRRDPRLGTLRVMASSATRDRETIVTLAKLKINGYLLKPYDAAKTIAQLKQVLGDLLAAPKIDNAARNLLLKSLMVVDDDEISRLALTGILRQSGQWDIVEARDGQEALNRLYDGLRPDLIFADLNMPRMGGFEMLQKIREEVTLRKLRVAVTSVSNDRELVRTLAQLQIAGYLLKPFEAAQVQKVLAGIPELGFVPPKVVQTAPPPAEQPAPATK